MLPKFRLHEKLTESDIINMNIDLYLDKVIDPKSIIHSTYKNLYETFCGEIPEDFVEKFKLNPYRDFILENLNTHDSGMLIEKIRKLFGFNVEDCSDIRDSEKRYIKLFISSETMSPKEVDDFFDTERFKNFANFFGYFISSHYDMTGGAIIYMEPIYADDANDKVYGESDGCSYGRIYHVTTKENAEKILNSGFRISSPEDKRKEDSVYRYYPKRVYFLAIPPKNIKIEERPEIVNAVNLYFSEKQKNKGYCILQADVRGLGIDFYKDSVAEGDYNFLDVENDAVYTYCNIPKERVKLVYSSK